MATNPISTLQKQFACARLSRPCLPGSSSPSGIRRVGSAKLDQAPVRNVRTWPAMPREKAQAAPTVRLKVPMRRRGADCLVVATKWGNAHGPKGGVIVVERGPTGYKEEEPAI